MNCLNAPAIPTLLQGLEFMASRATGCYELEAFDEFGRIGAELLAGLQSHGYAIERPTEQTMLRGRYYVMTPNGHRKLEAREAIEAADDGPEPEKMR